MTHVSTLDRRTFIRRGAMGAGALWMLSLGDLMARRAHAAIPSPYGPVSPKPDETTGLHLLEILAVAPFPVRVALDQLLLQLPEEVLDLFELIEAAKTDAVRVRDRHHQPRIIREKPKVIVAVPRRHDRRFADMLHDRDTVVRINELVPDLES